MDPRERLTAGTERNMLQLTIVRLTGFVEVFLQRLVRDEAMPGQCG